MKLIRKEVPDNFNLFLYGDLHVGSILHSDECLDEVVRMLKHPYQGCKHNIAVNHGDNIEAISIDDKRFDEVTVDPDRSKPLEQSDHVVNRLHSVAKNHVVILEGNHERKLTRNFGDLSARIAKDLGVPYGTYTSMITYVDKKGKMLFKHFAFHGAGYISTIADDPVRQECNLQLSLKRKLKYKAGDCVLMSMGRTHKLLVSDPRSKLYITSTARGIRQQYTESSHTDMHIHPDHRWYVNTGSMYKLYGENISSYAEVAGYDPLELGFCIARIRNREIECIDKVVI